MSRLIELFGGQFSVDREATIAAYSRIVIPGPEGCTCLPCRNWVVGRDRILTPTVRRMLAEFGVPPCGEIEVWHVPGAQKPHGYGGWYTVVGEIITAPPDDLSLEGWNISFSNGPSYAVDAFAGLSVFEPSFYTETDAFIPGDY